MANEQGSQYLVAVVGAGPAGLYASRYLAGQGVQVVLINRDIKPGGLAEYGIYHTKHKMKEGLRKQFRKILAEPLIHYYGNVTIGRESGFGLPELKESGMQAVMVTVGAQGTKWLGLPGEQLNGVYHAKDIVYHYNRLPPFSTQKFSIGERVALIGVGNVMLDIAHWAIRDLKVKEVIAVARRGPKEVKFTSKELSNVAANLDLQDLSKEFDRVSGRMEAIQQDPELAREYILSSLPKAKDPVSESKFKFNFLSSPKRIIGNDAGDVIGLEVEDTRLASRNGDTKARGLGTTRVLDVDTVIFCIGDTVDDKFGLPVQWNEFIKSQEPQYPVNDISYEAYDPVLENSIEGVFMAGWSREASSGLVGIARKDGESGAQALMQYLDSQPPYEDAEEVLSGFESALREKFGVVVSSGDIFKLEEAERLEAERRGLEFYKMKTNQEMLAVLKEPIF